MGRLKFECSCGVTDEDKYEKLCALSTRSWSIFNAETKELVWDSGMDVETVLSQHHPEIFNSDAPDYGDAQSDEFDARSDDKGPEVETLAVGVIDGKTLIFVGLERTSSVMVYDVSDPTAPVFHSSIMLSGQGPVPEALEDGTDTSQAEAIGVADPESMYVDEENKLLIVAGSVTGTVAVYSIDVPMTLANIDTVDGEKVLTVEGGSKITFAPDAFAAGATIKTYLEDVDLTLSPLAGSTVATKAIRFFASVAPTSAITFVLKLLTTSRRANTEHPIVHWLDETTNEWKAVCGTRAETTGEVSADLSPEILSSAGRFINSRQ